MADREVKARMKAASAMAEKNRLLDEIGYSFKSELMRLTVVVIALGLIGVLVVLGI
jgi:hypothetical protein